MIADEALAAAVKAVRRLAAGSPPAGQGARSPGRSLRPRRIPTISKPADRLAGLVVTARTVAEVLGEWKGISAEALLEAE